MVAQKVYSSNSGPFCYKTSDNQINGSDCNSLRKYDRCVAKLIIWVCQVVVLYTQQKSSAQVGVRVNSVLTRNDCIKYYISLFREIIMQELDAFQTEIQGSLTQLCAFKASRGHPSKVVKLPIMSPGAENMEYLNNP